MSLDQAISRYVRDGATVAIEGFGHLVPVAAAHEIIRQGIRNLTLARMTGDSLIDQMLAAGCLKRLVASFIGNSSAGSLHELRRRIEHSEPCPLELEEYSHGGMIGRYIAGASKLPFYPLRSYRGSDLPTANPQIKTVVDPYNGGEIHVVPALNPDVSIIHAQRADRTGNVQAWGILGVQAEVAFAGAEVIVTVEEVVDEAIIRSDPNRTIVPSHVVSAVVECPGGGYPNSVQGYYDRDDQFATEWSEMARDGARLCEWINKHIKGTRNHKEFLASLGTAYEDHLSDRQLVASPISYGARR